MTPCMDCEDGSCLCDGDSNCPECLGTNTCQSCHGTMWWEKSPIAKPLWGPGFLPSELSSVLASVPRASVKYHKCPTCYRSLDPRSFKHSTPAGVPASELSGAAKRWANAQWCPTCVRPFHRKGDRPWAVIGRPQEPSGS